MTALHAHWPLCWRWTAHTAKLSPDAPVTRAIPGLYVCRLARWELNATPHGFLVLRGYFGTRTLRRADIEEFRRRLQMWPVFAPIIEVALRDGGGFDIYLPGGYLRPANADVPLRQLQAWLEEASR